GRGLCRTSGFLLAEHFASDLVPQRKPPSRLCCPWGVSQVGADNILAPNHRLRPWSKSEPPGSHRGGRLSTGETIWTGCWPGESRSTQSPARPCIGPGGTPWLRLLESVLLDRSR